MLNLFDLLAQNINRLHPVAFHSELFLHFLILRPLISN